jgi:ATP-dependent exoDNAse (exonuclease V) beta subunit
VALTRAKNSVTLIWTNEEKNSWAARMWKPDKLGLVVNDDFLVEYRDNAQVTVNILSEQIQEIKLKRRLQEFVGKESGQVSVTKMLDQVQKLQSDQPTGSAYLSLQKAQSGVEAHRIFESMKYQQLSSGDSAVNKAILFLKQWQGGILAELIQRGQPEWGFTVKVGSKIIQGQIDLWGVDAENKLWIIDYKTGSNNYKDKAFQQLQIYSYALRTVKKELAQLSTQLAVVYPMQEQVFIEPARSVEHLSFDLQKALEV